MAYISTNNVQLSSGRLYDHNLLFLAKNITNGVVSLFALPIATLDGLSDLSKKYLNTATDDNYVYDSKGSVITNMTGQEQTPSATLTIGFKVDYNGRQEDVAYGLPSNIYEIAMMGGTFKIGADTYMVVSTTGTIREGKKASRCLINQEFGNLFKADWYYLWTGGIDSTTGEPVFQTNTFVDKAKLESNTFALESTTVLGSGKVSSLLMSALSVGNVPMSTADDADTYSAEATLYVDVKEGNAPMTENARKTFAVADTNKTFLEVDYIVSNTTAPADGVSGDVIAIVNPTTLAVKIATHDGTNFVDDVTGTFKQYARISANKFTTSTKALATSQRAFIVLKTVDATNGGVASDFDLSTGTVQGYCLAYTMNRGTEVFEPLQVSDITC